MAVDSALGKEIALALVKAVQDNKDYLSEIDGLIGDGDHGVNMNKGFTMFADKIADRADMRLDEAFRLLGRTLLGDIGGSMGPLYGSFFIEMAKTAKGRAYIDGPLFADMLDAALAGVQSVGGAQPGDKTLVDCLFPVCVKFRKAVNEGLDFTDCLKQMKLDAALGRDSTKQLAAKLGRASRLGGRSVGVPDAGACSCCIILTAIADKMISIGYQGEQAR